MSQGTWLTLERSLYPKSKLFKPVSLRLPLPLRPQDIQKRFLDRLAQSIPPTEQEKAYRRKYTSDQHVINAPDRALCDSFDDEDDSAWVQIGIYWVRRYEGPHPHCWTNSRIGAHCLWRNAPDSYSGWGFPYFSSGSMERFRAGMELLKPVLKCEFLGKNLLLSLERTLEGPIGCCWGIRTSETFWRIEHGDRIETIKTTKAALKRTLESLTKD